MLRHALLLSCASGALVLCAGAADAQPGGAANGAVAGSTAAGGVNGTTVTEIVVQAEKRETTLQRVPVAISVFTGAERDTVGIDTVSDMTNFAPGFTYDPENVHAYIRGIGRQSYNITDDARVASYTDGFYVYSPYGLGTDDLFVSQVQIERGPQNVGGKEAAAGAIDLISVRPTDSPYAEIRANVGNYGVYNLEAAVSNQVAPGLDVRISAYDHNQDQGYYNNLVNGISEGNVLHEWFVGPSLEWKPNAQTDLYIEGYVSGWDNRGDAGARNGFANGSWDETSIADVASGLYLNPNFGYAAIPGPAQTAALANPLNQTAFGPYVPTSVSLYKNGIGNNPAASNLYNFANPIPHAVNLGNSTDINGVFTYDFPGVQLKYIAGFQGYNYGETWDPIDSNVKSYTLGLPDVGGAGDVLGYPALTIYPLEVENYKENDQWFDHELSLESTTDSPLQWVAGVFYYQQHYNQPTTIALPDQPQLSDPYYVAFTTPAPANPQNYIYSSSYDFTYQDESVYGQVSYKLGDQLKFTGNLRYTDDQKYGDEDIRYLYFGQAEVDGYGPYTGYYTPALDITSTLICPTGTGVPGSASCTSGKLAPGVTHIATLGPGGYYTRDLGGSSSAVTGGAGVEWTPTHDILVYARYDRGYEALSFYAGFVGSSPEVSPEYLNSYQVGYKQTFGDKLLLAIDGFYYDYDNMQVPLSIATDGVDTTEFINVPRAMSTGLEVESYWTPIKPLLITFSYSFDYTSVLTGCSGKVSGGILTPAAGSLCLEDTNDPAAVEPGAKPYPGQAYVGSGVTVTNAVLQSVQGDPLPEAPENKLAVDVAYTFHFEPGSLTLSGAFAYRSSQDGTLFNRYYDNAPGWTDVDARALWKAPGDKYEVIAYVKNIFNTLQYIEGEEGYADLGSNKANYSIASGPYEGNIYELNPPRTFGVEVRYKFF